MGIRLRLAAVVPLIVVAASIPAGSARAEVAEGACATAVAGDFDESGEADLAVGVPLQDVDGAVNAGAVHIIYGGATGLSGTDDHILTQDSQGVDDAAENGDRFGSCLAAGDFNGDGQSDLAIGIPGENLGRRGDAGAISVIYGSDGLDALGPPTDDFIHQDSVRIGGVTEDEDRFGSSLAVGDFDGDGRDDLAVGAPFDDIVDIVDAGAINVIYGASGGLTGTGSQLLPEDRRGIAETSDRRDEFGASLASGDFDDDGTDDLAVGVPGEKIGGQGRAGSVHVIYSRDERLSNSGDRTFDQNDSGIEGTAAAGDRYGTVLAAAEITGDGFEDLAIGAPLDDESGAANAGVVGVIEGSDNGLTSAGGDLLADVVAEADDQFGSSLAAADFDDSGDVDLAVGTPGEDGWGAVTEIDFAAVTQTVWTQDTLTVEDASEAGDQFGYALVAGDFDGDGPFDLAIGVPSEDFGAVSNAGATTVLYGLAGVGPTDLGNQLWHQDQTGVTASLDSNEAGDRYGAALG